MTLSQKCQYALRAVFELSRRYGRGPVSINEIAEAQAVPGRFLEQIVAQLRQGGYVESRRGVQGGYVLSRRPDAISTGEIIRFFEGPLLPVKCVGAQGVKCPLQGDCAFMGLWGRAERAASSVYDSTTFQDLVGEYERSAGQRSPSYSI
jgi:Rrf2 family protein